jgi:hypothetical protein
MKFAAFAVSRAFQSSGGAHAAMARRSEFSD